jgi:hypothetical protein
LHDKNITYKNKKQMYIESAYITHNLFNPYLKSKKLFHLHNKNIKQFFNHETYNQLNINEKKKVLNLILFLKNKNYQFFELENIRIANSCLKYILLLVIDYLIAKRKYPKILSHIVTIIIRINR